MRIWIICVLLCFLAIGCASKSGNIEQTKNILDAIGAEEKLAGEEFEITAVPSHEKEEVGFNIAVEEGKLSCDLVDADLRRTLLKIAEDAQLQFVFSENVYGRVNAKLNNIDLEEGLRIILGSVHYILEKEAGIYSIRRSSDAPAGVKYHEIHLRYVSTEHLMKRIAALYKLPFELEVGGGSAIIEPDGVADLQPFAGPTSLQMVGVTIVKAIEKNVLLISGEASRVDEVLDLIAVLDQKVPQVLIETYLIEYDEEALRESGIDLSAELINGLSGVAFNARKNGVDNIIVLPAITSILSLSAIAEGSYKKILDDESASGGDALDGTDGDISATASNDTFEIAAKIHALMDESKLTIISKPYVIVSNGSKAFISAASQQYVIAAFPDQPLSTGSLEQVETRISFTILPTIISDNKIHIKLSLEQSEFTNPRTNAVLSTNKNTAITDLTVDNGETIVIGGVNSTREVTASRGIPFLRKIPILKYIFGASQKSSSTRKVNFYITPRILPLKEEIIGEKIEQ